MKRIYYCAIVGVATNENIYIVVFSNGWGNSHCYTDCINAWRKGIGKFLILSLSLSLNMWLIWSLNEFQTKLLANFMVKTLKINSKIMWLLWHDKHINP